MTTSKIPKNLPNVFDAEACIKEKYEPLKEKHGPMSTMKLQKLIYYCQAWSLALDKKPLFQDKIEAWVFGPVVRELFKANQGLFQVSETNKPGADSGKFNKDQQETIKLVVEHYGAMDGDQLGVLAHNEQPWWNARRQGNLDPDERGNQEITHEEMQKYYTQISS